MYGTRIEKRYVDRYYMVAGPTYTHKVVRIGDSNSTPKLIVEDVATQGFEYLEKYLSSPFRVVSVPYLGDCFTAFRAGTPDKLTCLVNDSGLIEVYEKGQGTRPLLPSVQLRLYIPRAG